MGKGQKSSGDRWEREVAKELGGRRQPSSGAFGTQHGLSSLTGDVLVDYPWFRPLHIECKYGYGGSKQLTLKREWIEKVRTEAAKARRYPALALKFKGVTGGDRDSATLICFDFDTWKKMMQELKYLYTEYLSRIKEDYEEDGNEEV